VANITLITRNFPPLTGGMRRLVYQLYQQLIKRYHCNIFRLGGCGNFVEPSHRVFETEVSLTPLILSLLKSIFSHVVGSRPDVVIGDSALVRILLRAESIVMIHGLGVVADSRLYQWAFVPFLRRADLIISNSHNSSRLALECGVQAVRIETIFSGVTIPASSSARSHASASLSLDAKTML